MSSCFFGTHVFTHGGALADTGIPVDGALLSWLLKPLFSWKKPQALTKWREKKEKGDPGRVFCLLCNDHAKPDGTE